MGHGVSSAELRIDCPSNISDVCQINWAAWSQNTGWIVFNPIPWNTGSWVLYNRVQWKLEWFAWSQNLGWIPMMWDAWDGIYFCTQAPSINVASWTIANEQHNIIINSCTVEFGTWTLRIVPRDLIWSWSEQQVFSYIWGNPAFTGVDLSIATIYQFEVIDPSGDILQWEFPVYSWPPDINLVTWSLAITNPWNKLKQYCDYPFHNPSDICPDWSTLRWSFFFWSIPSTQAITHIADGEDSYIYGAWLRDMYWNAIYTIPWIKDILLNLSISNNVDRFQIAPSQQGITYSWSWDYDIWDALYAGLSGSLWKFGSWQIYSWLIIPQKRSWNFEIKIRSFAPTKEWYKYTSTAQNDAFITQFNYTVYGDYGYTTGSIDLLTHFYSGKLKFTPAAAIIWMSGSSVNLGGYMYVTGTVQSYTNKMLTGIEIIHWLSLTGWVNAFLAVFRDPWQIDGWTQWCFADPSNPSSYTSVCSRWSRELSILQMKNPALPALTKIVQSFRFLFLKKSTTGINPSPPYSTRYESVTSYYIDGKKIVFNSYQQFENDWSVLVNNSLGQVVKILGNTNGDKIYETIQSEKQSKISSLSRASVRDAIRKNVEILSRSITTTTWLDFEIFRDCPNGFTSRTLPTNFAKRSYIVVWCDIHIQNDVSWNVWIIALKDDNGNGGNIWIDKNVKNLAAILFSEEAIIAWDGMRFYWEMPSSASEKSKQLYIFGTVISNNTIWGAAQVGDPVCPSWITLCTREIAMRYDLNHFRSWYGWLTPAERVLPVNAAVLSTFAQMYSEYWMIIEYNPSVLTNPPPWFKNIMQ